MDVKISIPDKIISGQGALDNSLETLRKMGDKVLIVTDSMIRKLGSLVWLTELLETAEIPYEVFDQVNGEPTDLMVAQGAEIYQKTKCDFIIAIGGGSSIDTMKAIAAVAGTGRRITEFMNKSIESPLPPMAAIPTTAGTGSEATQFTIITNTEKDIKMLLKGSALMPNLAIIDPRFTITAPPGVTVATGLDALTHAIEAYTSRKAQPLTDVFALYAVKRIFRYLPAAYKNGGDMKAREEMSIAALEAGIAFSNSSVTIVHGMSRPIGALFHVPHGISNAMLLEQCLTFAVDGAYGRFAELGKAINAADNKASEKEAAEAFLAAVNEICKELNVPTLKEFGIDKQKYFESLDKMVSDAMESGSPSNTIKCLTEENLLTIYRSLWQE